MRLNGKLRSPFFIATCLSAIYMLSSRIEAQQLQDGDRMPQAFKKQPCTLDPH